MASRATASPWRANNSDTTVIRVTSKYGHDSYAAISVVNTKSGKENQMSTAIATNLSSTKNIFSFSSPAEIFSQMQAIQDELSRTAFNLFERRGYNPGSALEDWLGAEASLLQPVTVSVDDKGNQLTVKAEVPDFSPEQLKVSVDGNMLSICGKDEQSQKDSKTGAESAQTSTSTRKIYCKFTLPSNVDSKRASATLHKGVLTLTLPKLDTSTKIEVKAA